MSFAKVTSPPDEMRTFSALPAYKAKSSPEVNAPATAAPPKAPNHVVTEFVVSLKIIASPLPP